MKVLLSGHACSPEHGSEPAVTWNFAWYLSRSHQVWVLTEPKFRADVERYLQSHPNPNLNFVWVSLNPLWDPRRSPDSEIGLRFHYLLWQRAVLREARRLHRIHDFDVAHHVSWGTVSAPPLLWRLPIPFIWGPIGGGQTAPPAFQRYFGRDWSGEMLRTLRVKMMPRMPALRKAIRESALLLSTNPDTTSVLRAAGAVHVRPFLSAGVSKELISLPSIKRPSAPKELKILWAGRLISIKALPLALEALARVERDLPVRLQVLGDGPLREEMEALARTLGIDDRVEFLGSVPWSEMAEYYRRADLFLFTGLRDSSPTVVLEAMAYSLPILTLDHQGVGAIIPPEAGIKVPVTEPDETVLALAKGIRQLAQAPEARQRMGEAGWACAQNMGWEQRANQMTEWYQEVVERHRGYMERCAYATL
jgi:glycosyltransferase involved in cell wall biosynthesis